MDTNKKEVDDEKEIPNDAMVVFEIAKQVEKIDRNIPRELIFRAAVMAIFGNIGL